MMNTGASVIMAAGWKLQRLQQPTRLRTISAEGNLNDQKSALVADVATGIGRVLEEGVGYPTLIYVVSPDAPYHLTVGAVYTYYEFPMPMDQRMTDEQWRALLESGNAPDAPEWTSSFIVK